MNKLTLLAAASLVAVTLNSAAQTRTNTNAAPPKIVLSETNTMKATVQDIDYNKREITLKGPKGQSDTFVVSDQVKNFPQIKKGDEVNVGYYESVGIAIAKPGENLPATGRREAMVTRAPGEKPGGVAVSVSDTTATVEDVNRDTREVTLKGPSGDIVIVKVDPSVGNLQRIKKGDTLTITRTEALAISVDKP
jgi:Cu/Ag efflux protein CusF